MGDTTPRRNRRNRGGVALGVLGGVLLSFFVVVFMLGRHHSFHDIYEHIAVHDPRLGHHDEHPIARKDLATQAHEGKMKEEVKKPSALEQRLAAKEQDANAAKDAAAQAADASQGTAKPADAKPATSTSTVTKKEVVTKEPAVVVDKTEDKNGLTKLDKQYTPTREMVQQLAQDGYLVVTWANYHYMDFVMTWVAHVKSVGVTGYIVGAMDEELLEHLVEADIHTFSMKSGLTTGDFGWGSKTFAKMGREKIRLCAMFLRLGVDVVIADVDVLWLKNPLPYFSRYPEAEILTSSDHLHNTHNTDELELWPQAASAANIGIMLFRNKSLPFVDHWVQVIEDDEDVWDQNAFNELFAQGIQLLEGDPHHYFMGYNGTLKMGILPVALFASGHTFFTQRMYQTLGLEPYAVHATFQFSGTPGKKNRMREMMLFEDPPSYYDHPGGFLTFEMDKLDELLPGAGPLNWNITDIKNAEGHFKLVNHQLIRVRTAMAIATLTGRAIVPPQMWCGMDRWWAPHIGLIPGSNFTLPFPCPLDHIFDLEAWTRKLDEQAHGPHIEYRESSFFNNPRMSAAVNESRVHVHVCSADESGCSDGSSPGVVSEGVLKLAPNLGSDQLLKALQATKDVKVLDFETMESAFGNFTKTMDWEKFANRMRTYASIWCCIDAHPGHIHYDMLHDVPHIDKFGFKWGALGSDTWELRTGP